MTERTRLLIVDDHPLYRNGFQDAIARTQLIDEIRTANTCAEALRQLESGIDFDLLICDWRLPDGDGLEFLRTVAQEHPTTARVLMSGTDDPRLPERCIEESLMGFLPKSLDASEIAGVMTRLLSGENWFPARGATPHMLSVRQTQILEGIAEGKTNKHLARELGISERTVKHHLTAIFERLGTTRRAEAVSCAVEQGLIRPLRR